MEITDEYVKEQVSKGRQYTLVHLLKGPNYDSESIDTEEIQKAHLRYLFKLKAEGKLLLVGPLIGDTKLRGIAIYDVQDIDEVNKLVNADPSVAAGIFTFETHRWFGIPGDGLPE